MAERIDLEEEGSESNTYSFTAVLESLVEKGYKVYELLIMDEGSRPPKGTRPFPLPELGVIVAVRVSKEDPNDTELPDQSTEPRTVA